MSFTSKQKEIVARKLGYDGPMQGFDEYLKSSPALEMRYNTLSDKYMARGGMVKKYATGGTVPTFTNEQVAAYIRDNALNAEQAQTAAASFGVSPTQLAQAQELLSSGNLAGVDAASKAYRESAPIGSAQDIANQKVTKDVLTSNYNVVEAWTEANAPVKPVVKPVVTPVVKPVVTGGGSTTFTPIGGMPIPGAPASVTAAQITEQPNQLITGVGGAGTAAGATLGQAGPAATAAGPTMAPVATYDAAKATPGVKKELAKVKAEQGTVSEEAQITAEQQEPTTTVLQDLEAAQLEEAQTVQAPEKRTIQEGELVSGPAVDQERVAATLEETKASAAQGAVTEEMTVQGQLNKLMTDFDAGNPPPWAAASLRSVTATLAARGLGVSSLAGQALIQATLESALPIASADAQAYQAVAAQNLSNRQQTAVLAAQQRAAFLGQEFDQAFQTRVTNASRVADVANMNFTAQQQIALENARMAQTVDLANLSNSQAMVMATAAQVASLEMANLNNRQQAAVINAQSFLAMDMKNLDNRQQTTLFKAQQITQALLSDTSMENAARQFNASSINQSNQFEASLTTQVNQFNAAQKNAMTTFNTDQANSIAKFNSELKSQREQFNASQRLVIDQSNAQWRRELSTANTAATNAANYLNAQNIQQMTLAEYNNMTQLYRDQVDNAFKSAENDMERATNIAIATLRGSQAASASSDAAIAALMTGAGKLFTSLFP